MLQRLRSLGGSSRSTGERTSQDGTSSPQQQPRRGVSFRRRIPNADDRSRDDQRRRVSSRSQVSNQSEARRQIRQRNNIIQRTNNVRTERGAKEDTGVQGSLEIVNHAPHAEAKIENVTEEDNFDNTDTEKESIKLESNAKNNEKLAVEEDGSSEHFRMPELDEWITERDAKEYAAKCIDICARVQRHEMENYGAKELTGLCTQLEFDAIARAKYAKLFEDNALDGWVFLEIVDWEDYSEIGIAKPHAVALCAVAKGVRGDFGYAMPRPSPSTLARDDRLRTRAGIRLTCQEEDALRMADIMAKEPQGIGSVYGQLVVLGYKEYRVEGSTWHPVGPRNEKFELRRRKRANGIRRSRAYVLQDSDITEKKNLTKRSTEASHSVTMNVAASKEPDTGRITQSSKRVTVEYIPDAREDMFQLGRMIVPQNDFVVRGPLHLDSGGVLCGPVSRYACRITCSRLPPFHCKLYAAGFNNERDIFLSEMAPKWQLKPDEIAADDLDAIEQKEKQIQLQQEYNGTIEKNKNMNASSQMSSSQPKNKDTIGCQWDALTTFGVRIWKPEIGAWREVSVHGGVHEPRQRADVAGARYPDENSTLTDGTIIDLAGIQLLFESADSMRNHDTVHYKPTVPADETRPSEESVVNNEQEEHKSPSNDRYLSAPDRIVARFNARRPQCPVQLHTIRLEYDEEKRKALSKDRTPYIFPACGHVHAYAPELR